MHAVVRRYTSPPHVLDAARPKLADLERTMRGTPGFVAYYFVETDEGIATVTITDDEAGTAESTGRAADWVRRNLASPAELGSPEVTRGTVLIGATR